MRLGKHWAITCLAIGVLMMVPREASAFWDWIHELSGPSMMGIGYTCRLLQPKPFRAFRTGSPAPATLPAPTGAPPSIALTTFIITTKGPHGLESQELRNSFKIEGQSVVVTVLDTTSFVVRTELTPTKENLSVNGPALNVAQIRLLGGAAFSFDQCFRRTPDPKPGERADLERFHFWVRLESYFYYSVKHGDDPYGPPVYAFTPGALFELSPTHPGNSGKSILFFGAGGECFRFWSGGDRQFWSGGDSYGAFWRCAVKFRPLAVRINPPAGQRLLGVKALEAGVDTRYFPRGFVPRNFGVDRGPIEREGGEWTLGLFFSAVLR
jgi:hypothetical protein